MEWALVVCLLAIYWDVHRIRRRLESRSPEVVNVVEERSEGEGQSIRISVDPA